MWQKVEVVWVDGSVRLLGASASKPAMGCGGSKAQPASEVDSVPCFCFDCVFLSSSPCAFLLSECHYVWRRVDSCDRFDTPLKKNHLITSNFKLLEKLCTIINMFGKGKAPGGSLCGLLGSNAEFLSMHLGQD